MRDYSFVLKNINPTEKIYIAYSGGLDSSVLLDIFYKLSKKNSLLVEAIHVNHNINKESEIWEDHCKAVCNSINIPIKIISTRIVAGGGGIESAARNKRYEIFKNTLEDSEQILTAHHQDDTAETLLLRLFRGTGIDGLIGPAEIRELGKGNLIRPLLSLSKKHLKSYADENGISYIEDKTNFSDDQDRNYIRNKILPLANDRWVEPSSRVSKTSNLIKNKLDIYKDLFKSNYSEFLLGEIDLKKLKSLDREVIKEILRFSIKEKNIAMPSQKVMEEILKTFIDSNPGPKSIVSWKRSDAEQVGGSITYYNKIISIQENG
jgi:tRNA(Ile)-lysidine synthase